MEEIVSNVAGSRGLFVPIDHHAVVQSRSPEYIYGHVEKRIAADEVSMLSWLEACNLFIDDAAFDEINNEKTDERLPYWNNGYFGDSDARSLVAMLRRFNPGRYIEIGSGNSTKFARWAVDRWSLKAKILCIDPVPRAYVAHVADEVVEKSLLEVGDGIFETLTEGDILFYDGSHIVFNGTDTTKFFLEILPLIRPGVVIHVHDICLPWEYVSAFDNRGYNEQYLFAALLLYGSGWEVLAPINYLYRKGLLKAGGSSFWIRRR